MSSSTGSAERKLIEKSKELPKSLFGRFREYQKRLRAKYDKELYGGILLSLGGAAALGLGAAAIGLGGVAMGFGGVGGAILLATTPIAALGMAGGLGVVAAGVPVAAIGLGGLAWGAKKAVPEIFSRTARQQKKRLIEATKKPGKIAANMIKQGVERNIAGI